ncbi:protein zer-1 homolog [Lycorma delicatula]|uniref:protein zer-1 homolog n=1 Tax=Lycorma delicatula TaxID=130591 RepID=UPI003F51A395
MFPINPGDDENEPESLLYHCLKFVARNLEVICYSNPHTKGYELINGLALPREICEKLLQIYQQNGYVLNDQFVRIFGNPAVTSLKAVQLRNSSISNEGLAILLKHRLTELEINKCNKITEEAFTKLNEYGDRLQSLVIGAGVDLLPHFLPDNDYILKTPNLRRLAVRNLRNHGAQTSKLYFRRLLNALPNLACLDLSGCNDLDNMLCLTSLPNLISLTLHNVPRIADSLIHVCQLRKLRHLDISQANDKSGTFYDENSTLALIVESLPNLVSLDISGTNLAGTGVAEPRLKKEEWGYETDIPGLISRVQRPFEFLGLYGTHFGACRRHDIPAKLISGDGNESQILTAAAAYIERPEILQRVLNDLYHLLRYETCHDISQALSIVLDAMDRHLSEKHIQISGSASLFYIVKNKETPALGRRTKRNIITALLNGMNEHRDDDTMMRNGCLTLCQFKIPQDVLFEYERLVLMLLHIVSEMEQEGFVQRIGIYLLNSLACQVDGCQKQLLGDLGAISRMLELIDDRVKRDTCDDVLEVAWSTMWNVTDETAINCQRFLDGKGMEYFLACLQLFPRKDELMRNMMGLLGNVAEVQPLRPRLMTDRYVSVFADLVDSCSDGIEVSYNAAGVLSHMASDGEEAWTISKPCRAKVLDRMVAAIERWNISTERNINYRSFEPILQLAKVRHTPQCQHWAVWALANLTSVYPEKYCSLVESEGGIQILENVIADDAPYQRIKDLAAMVIDECRKYRERNHMEQQQHHGPPQLDG